MINSIHSILYALLPALVPMPADKRPTQEQRLQQAYEEAEEMLFLAKLDNVVAFSRVVATESRLNLIQELITERDNLLHEGD